MSGIGPISGYSNMQSFQSISPAMYAKRVQIADENQNTSFDVKLSSAQETQDTQNSRSVSDIFGKSTDGDTLSSSQASRTALQDGLVYAKPEIPAAMRAREAGDDSDTPESLAGFTADQLETMYLQGRISIIDYDQEIDRRAELELLSDTEDAEEDTTSATNATEDDAKTSVANVNTNVMQKDEKTSEVASDEKLSPYEQQREEEEKAARLDETKASDSAFANEMGTLLADKQNISLKSDALDTGLQNGRIDLVSDIIANNPTQQ